MAEKSGGAPAGKGPCKKCGQKVEAKASGDVCAKCKSQLTGESASPHGANGQGQAEAGQRGNDQVTSGTGGSETLQVASKGGVNAGQENQARGSGGAGGSAAGSGIQDKRLGGEGDLNRHQAGVMDTQRVGTDNKEVKPKSMVNPAEAQKTSTTTLPGVMSYASAAASNKGMSSTSNPGQGRVKQGNTSASADSQSTGDEGPAQVLVNKTDSTKSGPQQNVASGTTENGSKRQSSRLKSNAGTERKPTTEDCRSAPAAKASKQDSNSSPAVPSSKDQPTSGLQGQNQVTDTNREPKTQQTLSAPATSFPKQPGNISGKSQGGANANTLQRTPNTGSEKLGGEGSHAATPATGGKGKPSTVDHRKEVQSHPLKPVEATSTSEPAVGIVATRKEQFDRDKDGSGSKDKDKQHSLLESPKPPPAPPIDVSGIRAQKSHGIEVTLHVLFPLDLWDFEKQKSQVCICFGHTRMGDWKPATVLKYAGMVGDNLHEFVCCLCIDGTILRYEKCVPYKYFVTSQPKPWEFLHGAKSWGGEIVNRCLQVPIESFKIGGTFHQYDGIMYPEKPVKTVWSTVRGWFGGSSATEMSIPSHDLVQQQCLHVYLRHHREILLNCQVADIYSFTMSILPIFHQMRVPRVHYYNYSHVWKADGVTQAMNEWLLQVMKELRQVVHNPANQNGKRMASVLSIIFCFDHLIPRYISMSIFKNEDIADMLSMLTLSPNVEQRKCLDYDYVNTLVKPQMRKTLAEAILSFCIQLHHKTFLFQPKWLYAVPLLHFLQGVSQPFGNFELDPQKMKWGDASLGLNSLRQRVHGGDDRLIEDHYVALEPLIIADPMLLPVLVYICPRKQLPFLIQKMPVFVSAAWIAHLIDETPNLNQTIKDMFYLTNETLSCQKKTTTQLKQPVLEATVQASIQLLTNMMRKMNIISDDSLSALRVALSLSLYSAHSLVLHIETRSNTQKLSQTMMKIHTNMSTWVARRFRSAFQIDSRHQTHNRMEELKIWNLMFQVDCPEATRQFWHNLIAVAIKQRVNIVSSLYKVDLIIMLGSYKGAHHTLKQVFIEAMIETLEQLISNNHMEIVSSTLERINNQVPDKKIVGIFLGNILKRKYPQGLLAVTPTECFKWPLWPTFLKIYNSFRHQSPKTSAKHIHFQLASCSELKPSFLKWIVPLSDEEMLYMTCSHAVVVLEEVYSDIVSGEITIKQLRKMEEQKEQLVTLCKAASSGKDQQYLAVGTLLHQMKKHKSEYGRLINKVGQLKTLFSKVAPYLKIERSEYLIEKLHANYDDVCVKSLCSSDRNEHSLVQLLEETAPLESMLNGYICLADIYTSDIFDRVWDDQIKDLPAGGTLSVADIRTKLWDPVITKCTELLTTLQQCTITLSVVDEYFYQHRYRKEEAMISIVNLCNGLSRYQTSCEGKEEEIQKIRRGVDLMQQYWSLCDYANAAKICLELKEKLELTGDFQMVEILAKQDTASMKDQSLHEVDQTLISTGRFLQVFATEDKLHCLRTYCSCMNIISWLKSNTKDVTDLQNFVTVALNNASSGEDMLTNTKLASLRTVGSGFGCLIYDLKKDADFDTLAKQCRLLWEGMVHTPNLPRYLEDCNNEVEWFKEVKAQQGSVKETSFGQMNACINHGKYRVGQSGDKIFHVMSEVVHLTVEAKHTRVYTLDELKDLESKLVLITGSKDEKRQKVDGFLDTLHSICEIAEVLMVLQQVGNVKYIGWSITVPCSPELIPELRKLHSLMQTELEDWKEAVRAARQKHYELNYFTTPQLLSLRQELGRLASSSSVDLQVVALLQSISPHISTQSIRDAVHREVGKAVTSKQEIEPHQQVIGSSQTAMNESKNSSQSMPSPPKKQIRKKDKEQQSAKTVQQPSTLPKSEGVTPEEMKRNEILANIVSAYGERYKGLVRKAFKEGMDEQIEIENWVMENEDQISPSESDESGEEEDTSSEEETEEEEDGSSVLSTKESVQQSDILSVPKTERQRSLPIEELHMVTKEAVDISHPAVQELISAGFNEEESITAIEKWGTPEEAADYLIAMRTQSASLQPAAKSEIDGKTDEGSNTLQNLEICCYKKAEQRYLKLDELGNVLKILSSSHLGVVQQPRTFHSKLLKAGSPNLLVVPPDHVLKTALSLYMEDKTLPLPTFEEILICTPSTTSEEVDLLWRRAVEDPNLYRIFCLVHAENLPYQTSDQAFKCLNEAIQGKKGYRLVIICGSDKEDSSLIVSKLSLYRTPYLPPQDLNRYQEYLRSHFESGNTPKVNGLQSCVRVVSSRRAGMGKTLYIHSMAVELTKLKAMSTVTVTVPIHGPNLSTDNLIEALKDYMDNQQCVVHLEIAPSVMWQMDTTLFSMLIQGGLSDSRGRVWRLHPSQMYAIEVTLTAKEVQLKEKNCKVLAVLELLPKVECITPQQCLSLMKRAVEDPAKVLMNATRFESPQYQRVYQYLRRHKANQDLDNIEYRENSVEGKATDCLQVFLSYCGIKDPSWAEIDHFVRFLEIQLRLCEKSVFCNKAFVGDVLDGFKNFVVKFMIRMSRDFATSSLKGEVAEENDQSSFEDNELDQYQIAERKLWEQSSHPYLFFNQDGISLTFVGFMVSPKGDLIDVHRDVLERAIMTTQLKEGLKHQGVDFEDNYQTWSKQKMVQKIATVMGLTHVHDPDKSYVLTVDNLLKILAIQMRFRCGIPVVVMGETGCGKTRLIRFMCDLAAQSSGMKNMLILKVHGGISEEDVMKFIQKAQKQATANKRHGLDTVVFFDEANTTDAIGLIREIMCDRRMYGKGIPEDLKFIAACNPYRRHTDDMVKKLETAGLGFFVQAEETQQKLGTIPLRNLVYRVQDLPPSMRPLVYDFGQLNTNQEEGYIYHIVSDHVDKHSGLSKCTSGTISVVSKVLSWSQKYMRERKDECSFVSLRDVERAMLVFEYFYDKMDLFSPLMDSVITENWGHTSVDKTDNLTRSLILALSVCYHARLQERAQYEKGVVSQFTAPLTLPGKEKQFQMEIRRCQEVLLDSMQLGKNIARNAALRENVFMMAICIDLRIPLFLVGKPGSSKSLAKSIVSNSLNGKSSKNELLRSFKEVHMFSYQCSQLSTSESIIKVFDTAKSFQKEDTTTFVSVVVLDEVGLAEDSPNLPLKALHPLLEDGTAGADRHEEQDEREEDYSDEIVEREKRVAFIGISNWALDPAKMNRGVMVTRGDPDVEELKLSARGICSTKERDEVRDHLRIYFKPLAEAYHAICSRQKRQFFGLRDFYSLIKMLYWMCEQSGMPPTGAQLRHAIMRNFGGMQEFNPYLEFKKRLPETISQAEMSLTPESYDSLINPDCTPHGLIKASLRTKDITWHGENRYLLFLTENYAALEVLKHYIHEPQPIHETRPMHEPRSMIPRYQLQQEVDPWDMEPFVLFGSSFPKDTEYTQVCRNINQIKICMETGRMVVLLNLHNLYESLYDLLNQYYIRYGEERYVDLGLQTHKLKCKVHKEFKLIMIAEKDTVYQKFPTPLINRLEKHFVLMSSVLTHKETRVMRELEKWVKAFSTIKYSSCVFQERDAFIGYRNDTPAAVVFQANHQVQRLSQNQDLQSSEWNRFQDIGIFTEELTPARLLSEKDDPDVWTAAVLRLSQYLLLCTASPAALVRLLNTVLSDQFSQLCQLYKGQHHSSISDFLDYHIQFSSRNSKLGLLMQVTTHSHLLSYDEVKAVQSALQYEDRSVKSFLLQDFDTELHFSSRVGPLFKKSKESTNCKLIIIQCDMGYIAGDLIACARNRIYDMRAKAARECKADEALGTHVLFVIYLPVHTLHSSLVGFQGDPWISAHIDEIRPSSDGTLTLDIAQGVSISKLFYGPLEDDILGRVSMPPVLPAKPVESGPTSQQIPSVAGPATQVIGSVTGPTAPAEDSVAGPTAQVISSVAGPTTQVISTVGGSTVQVVTSPALEAMPVATATVVHIPQAKQKKDIPRMYTQCRRLHICIQAAASRLVHLTPNKKWATKRVELLTDLIPSNPEFPIDERSFYGILVKHIHCLLQQRNATYGRTSNWVLNEAMDLRKLHIGGTFKNVLARKLDEVVIPLFAEVIALVDHNYNLSHLKQLSHEQSAVQEFWLRMFSDPKVLQLNYSEIIGREKVPVLDDNFKCQLPFSWLIKEAVDNHWELIKSTSDKTMDVYHQMCSVFPETPIGEVLSSFDSHWASNDFMQRYINDFLQMAHKCNHADPTHMDKEYKLLQATIANLAENSHFVKQAALRSSPDGSQPSEERRKTLTTKIIAVHVVYHSVEEHIHWFGQLTSYMPGILETLSPNQEQPQESLEMVLHLQALQEVLTILKPPIKKDESIIKQWLNHITVCQNAIDSILLLPSEHALAKSARESWQRIRVLQVFVEHVMMKHDGMVQYANRLDLHMRKDPNLLKSNTMERMKKFLKSVNEDLRKIYKSKESKKKLHAITKSCDDFLIEVVSSLCFGQQTAPEDDLIEMLLNLIFTETEEESGSRMATKELTLYRQKQDETPVVRSFLLQLLLGQNFEQVRKHLCDFFERSKQSLSAELNQELCLMCTQCFEDALVKKCSSMSFDDQISTCAGLLRDGRRVIDQIEPDASMEYLEGIANVRYALMVVAKLLHRKPSIPIMVQTVAKMTTQLSKDVIEQEDSDEGQLFDSAEDKAQEGISQIELEPVFQPLVPTEPIEETEHIEVEIIDTPPTDISAEKQQKQTSQPQVTSGFVDDLEGSTPSTPVMVQNVAKEAAQPSRDMAEQEDSKDERQLSDISEDRAEEGTSQNELEPQFQPLVPIKETEHIEVEIVDTKPTDVSADKKQEQVGQPQEIGEFVEESEESIPKLKVSTEDNMDTGYTEVAQTQHPLIASASVDSDAGSIVDPATQLLLAAQSTCRASLTAGPSHYLLKLIVRQFGFSFLRKLVKVHPWVIPQGITWTGQEEETSDPFVMYGDPYIDLREAIGSATHSEQFADLREKTKDMQLVGTAFLLLGIYQKITRSRASKISTRAIPTMAFPRMTTFIQDCKHLSEEMKLLAKRLVANEQGGPLSALCVSPDNQPEHRTLGGIVVHAVTVLLCRNKNKAGILLPFDHMLHDPSALVNAHLPTMPEGILPENMVAIAESGQFYECTYGHPIFVGECQKLTKATCSDCGAQLKNVKLDPDMLKLETKFSGHCLGRPEERNPLPAAERSLNPAACSIVRAIMHSALVYVSCNNKTATKGLLGMVKVEGIDRNELPEFFWGHLEQDIKILAQAIGKNEEEAAIVLHLVLQQILTCEPPKTGHVRTMADLETPYMRNEWERAFNAAYIQPVLENLNKGFGSAMRAIVEESKQEHDPLLYMVYEHGGATEKSLEPYLWTYRSRITLEHLALLLQPQQDKYRILAEFLKQEPVLRATQYLPDIVKLQHHLQKTYHYRISVKEAQEKTIGEFLEEKFLQKEMLSSMATAWSLVKSKIRDHGRVKVERRFLEELTLISEDTPLQYIIPTTTGPGTCSLALVDYLVLQHNSFIEMCQGVVIGDDKTKLFWKAHRVPLPLIHHCHLLSYEQQLLSIVLSHCHYSLQVGQGQDVTYDLPALEKHILDRFIQGKPKIVSELQPVAYVKELYIASNFSAVRMKVKQVELSTKVQEDILSDLVEIDQLCDSLDVVNILLGFLSTGGGRADSRLEDYLRKLRMETKPISKMAKEHCRLEHILSLWKTLSVGIAKKMISRGQEPFDIDGDLLRDLKGTDKWALDQCLRSFPDLDSLLGTMCEFVETHLRHNITEQQDWTLVDTMTAYLEQNQLEVPPQLADFPCSILLSHTVATWKHIVAFQTAKQ